MGVFLLAGMFSVFILQVVFRYVIESPLSWTLEACLIAWLWTVFWGCAFTVRDREHVRFDIAYQMAGPRLRRVFALLAAAAIVAAFALSFPRVWDYVSFMAIESSSSLGIGLNWIFLVYPIFAVAIIVRYAWRAVAILRGTEPEDAL